MSSKAKALAVFFLCMIVGFASTALAKKPVNTIDVAVTNTYIQRDKLETTKENLKLKLEIATLKKQLRELNTDTRQLKTSGSTRKHGGELKNMHVPRKPRRKSITVDTVYGFGDKIIADIKVGRKKMSVRAGDTIPGFGKIIAIKGNELVLKQGHRVRSIRF